MINENHNNHDNHNNQDNHNSYDSHDSHNSHDSHDGHDSNDSHDSHNRFWRFLRQSLFCISLLYHSQKCQNKFLTFWEIPEWIPAMLNSNQWSYSSQQFLAIQLET